MKTEKSTFLFPRLKSWAKIRILTHDFSRGKTKILTAFTIFPKMKKLIFFIATIILFCGNVCEAQMFKLKNVEATQNGDTIVVDFEVKKIILEKDEKTFDISASLYYSLDGGKTFQKCKSLFSYRDEKGNVVSYPYKYFYNLPCKKFSKLQLKWLVKKDLQELINNNVTFEVKVRKGDGFGSM